MPRRQCQTMNAYTYILNLLTLKLIESEWVEFHIPLYTLEPARISRWSLAQLLTDNKNQQQKPNKLKQKIPKSREQKAET